MDRFEPWGLSHEWKERRRETFGNKLPLFLALQLPRYALLELWNQSPNGLSSDEHVQYKYFGRTIARMEFLHGLQTHSRNFGCRPETPFILYPEKCIQMVLDEIQDDSLNVYFYEFVRDYITPDMVGAYVDDVGNVYLRGYVEPGPLELETDWHVMPVKLGYDYRVQCDVFSRLPDVRELTRLCRRDEELVIEVNCVRVFEHSQTSMVYAVEQPE